MHTSKGITTPLPWLAGLITAYLLIPVGAFIFRLPAASITLTDTRLISALLTSLASSCIAVTIIAVSGVPLAYLLAKSQHRFSRFIDVAVQLPLALPPLISGILLIYIMGPYTPLGRLFHGHLTGSMTGIVLAQTFVAAPFLIVSARSAFAAIDPDLFAVAATLGHGRWARFIHVAIPVALPGIQAGLLLSWLRAFGEFGATIILSYHPFSLPVYTFIQFNSTGLPGTLAPVSVVLIAAFIVLGLAHFKPARRRKTVQLPPATKPQRQQASPLQFDLEAHFGDFSLAIKHRANHHQLALLGPSGSGKTITLKLLAGIGSYRKANVHHASQALTYQPPETRKIGYVPQHSALLPRRNVWQQITFGVNAHPATAAWWLKKLHLEELVQRYPDELSGGQQRRVALARALALNPQILLLDEPFSALDTPVRRELQYELRNLQHNTGLTTVLVTHDPKEAALLGNEILVINNGRLLQTGTPETLFKQPASCQVAQLLGVRNMFEGKVINATTILTHGLELSVAKHTLPAGTPVHWSIAPFQLKPAAHGHYPASILDAVNLGTCQEIILRLDNSLNLVMHTHATPLHAGDSCHLYLPEEAIRFWPQT